MPLALFGLLDQLPFTAIASGLAVAVIVVYFVTSSDSGSLVVDLLSSGGKVQPPTRQRVFWAVLEGGVAGTLVLAGGLDALRTAAVTTAAPFSVLIVLMCAALVIGLRRDFAKEHRRRRWRDLESPRAVLREPHPPGEVK